MLSDKSYPFLLKILKETNEEAIITAFIRLIEVVFKQYKNIVFLRPCIEGRELYAIDGNKQSVFSETISFDLFDFTHPFSHVVQKNKRDRIEEKDFIHWHDSKEFVQFIKQSEIHDSIEIVPIESADNQKKLLGLLIYTESNDKDLPHINNKRMDDFKEFLIGLLTIQITQMNALKQINYESSFLNRKVKKNQRKESLNKSRLIVEKILIGKSQSIENLTEQILRVASTPLSIFIYGETGTGKELVARSLHQASERKRGEFVAVNCSAIPEELIESELFGVKKGAYTGADIDRKGLIECADKGVLFLDEIGDMPYEIQTKLLRVLETKSFRRLGESEKRVSDFRLISATNINLEKMIDSGKFREDLYYRINQYRINVPNLNDRREDVLELANHFIKNINKEGRKIGIDDQGVRFLLTIDYQGNIRELKNLIETAFMLTTSEEISRSLLEEIYINNHAFPAQLNKNHKTLDMEIDRIDFLKLVEDGFCKDLPSFLENIEKKVVEEIMNNNNGHRGKSAKQLGIPLRTLSYKCQKLDI